MAEQEERHVANVRDLTVSERVLLNDCQSVYNTFTEYYDCEIVEYQRMKDRVNDFVRERIAELATSPYPAMGIIQQFYLFARHNLDNLNLLMDIFLLVVMDDCGDHREGVQVEYYLLYKYGPY
ncbi:unnamed protein product [Caenorhabditis sp. 36 PRJEB53466]|nr:unnamed protein product [Caenorhabditis sp. 36 PRJEB53466]